MINIFVRKQACLCCPPFVRILIGVFIHAYLIETLSIVFAFSALSVVALTLFVSHKISGPLYRLTKEIEKIKEGDLKANFTTRKNDQLKGLSVAFAEMSGTLVLKYSELKGKIEELTSSCRSREITKKKF